MRDCKPIRTVTEYILLHLVKNILVLMNAHQIEPILLLCARLKKLDLSISKSSKQALISNIAHAVQGEFRLSLLQQDWLDDNVVRFGSPSVVIEQTGNLKQIQGS